MTRDLSSFFAHLKGGFINIAMDASEVTVKTLPPPVRTRSTPQMALAIQRVREWVPGSSLDLSRLDLIALPDLPPNLTDLSCMFNKLLSLPTLPDTLVSLNVCYNQLTQLPEQLPPNLESLLCIWNQLEKLPDSLPTSLRSLHCDTNNLTCLPARLPDQLCNLTCTNNNIHSLPEILPPTLDKLNVENTSLPKRLFGESVRCYHERITTEMQTE